MMPAVLLVEDNPDDEGLVARALRRLPNPPELEVARDGVEAIGYFFGDDGAVRAHGVNIPAVVLLDIKMPRMDGFEVLRHLRTDERTRAVPVVMFTSSDEERDIFEAYKLGASSYVRKPLDFEEFAQAVREIVQYWCGRNQPVPKERRPARAAHFQY